MLTPSLLRAAEGAARPVAYVLQPAVRDLALLTDPEGALKMTARGDSA